MTREHFDFVKFDERFEGQIVDLRCRSFGGSTDANADYLGWKYKANPYVQSPVFYLALVDGRVVGMRGMYAERWRIGPALAPRVVLCATDLAVDPDYRGRGLAGRIMAFAQRDLEDNGHELLLSLSANGTTRRLQLRSGWRRAAVFQTFRRGRFAGGLASPGRPGRLNNMARRISARIGCWSRTRWPRAAFRRLDARTPLLKPPIVASSEPRVRAMSRLAEQLEADSLVHQIRDEQFYSWRFNDPHSAYRFLYFTEGPNLEGFVVLHERRSGGPVTVLDWAATAEEVWTKLIDATVLLWSGPLQIAATRFTDHELRTIEASGFAPLPYSNTPSKPAPGVFVYPLKLREGPDTGASLELDRNVWDMRMISSDMF